MQTQDAVEGLHNGQEFSQPCECKHRKKHFLVLLWNNFPKKNSKTLLFRALIKREIVTSREVLYSKLVHLISPCFPNKMLFSLKMSAQAKKTWHSMFLKIFQVSADEEMGK